MIENEFTKFLGVNGPITPRKSSTPAAAFKRPSTSDASSSTPVKRVTFLDV